MHNTTNRGLITEFYNYLASIDTSESYQNGLKKQNKGLQSDLPIGITMSSKRKESDSLGEVEVPADYYWWGSQTPRSLHFSIGDDRMPKEVYHAYGYVKKAAAIVNASTGRLPRWKADLIARVADEAIATKLDRKFPHYVWQTWSGTVEYEC